MMIQADAPGKLVLLGEYAVLGGAPALVAAVDRRVRVRLIPGNERDCSISAPGLLPEPVRISPEDDNQWKEKLPLPARAAELYPGLIRKCSEIILDTGAFFRRNADGKNVKLGLGSSAALSTALLGALRLLEDIPDPPSMEELLSFHRSLQGGTGSGIDLAAALKGGVLRYRLDPSSGRPEVRPLVLPQGLHFSFVWTGEPARTGDFLAGLQQSAHPDETRETLRRMADLSRLGLKALENGHIPAFRDVVDCYCDAMEALGILIGREILSKAHQRLRRLARKAGVAYKPSGAGGGDFGMAVSESAENLQNFREHVREAGYEIPGLSVDLHALHCFREEEGGDR